MTTFDYPPVDAGVIRAFGALQRAAARAVGYHDDALVEAITHHCALKVASATAPTDILVGQFASAEIAAKMRLLRMKVTDLEGVAVRARYFKALKKIDDWERDPGSVDALLDGLAGAA